MLPHAAPVCLTLHIIAPTAHVESCGRERSDAQCLINFPEFQGVELCLSLFEAVKAHDLHSGCVEDWWNVDLGGMY